MSRYHENRDKSEQKRSSYVSIPRESGQTRAERKRLCLDTMRIGTNQSRKEAVMSRYRENRDKQEPKRNEYVSIPRESVQIRAERRQLCLDTTRIGTNKIRKEAVMSRYHKNRDKQEPKRSSYVSAP
ncbi:hypothetical protein [Metabacillus litoralis]|uniref:hypothetical protein n=1 Tax=Metabacillus litoralis TaxID=152268 RepID=UPI00203EB532|nr:hypothetical protein [Metabacillus litoralis]